MTQTEISERLAALAATAAHYCAYVEHATEYERDEFVTKVLEYLPKIYLEFSTLDENEMIGEAEFEYFPEYVDEDYYEMVRRNVASLMGEEDIYLDTFEEDMKYSEHPIAASVSESLADIFQPLFNFVSVIMELGAERSVDAFKVCKENFVEYWSQTLCNVMRPLNNLKYKN